MSKALSFEIETDLPVEEAATRLRAAFASRRDDKWTRTLHPRLYGVVSADKVVVSRRGGASAYGRFEGQFAAIGSPTRLIGFFVPTKGAFVKFCACWTVGWASLVVTLVAWSWKGIESLGWIVVAIAVAFVGPLMIWLRNKNVRAEAELLRQDLVEVLRGPGA